MRRHLSNGDKDGHLDHAAYHPAGETGGTEAAIEFLGPVQGFSGLTPYYGCVYGPRRGGRTHHLAIEDRPPEWSAVAVAHPSQKCRRRNK